MPPACTATPCRFASRCAEAHGDDAKNGKLTAKELSIPFAHAKPKVNEYNRFNDGTVAVTHNAEITKNAKKKANGGKLSFFINDYSGAKPVFRTVIYQLD